MRRLHLVLGAYVVPVSERALRGGQWVASAVLLAIPGLFTVAFFREPALADLERPWARPAIT